MAFRRQEKKSAEKVKIIKCNFCKSNDSVANVGKLYYCGDSKCTNKFWEKTKKTESKRNKKSTRNF